MRPAEKFEAALWAARAAWEAEKESSAAKIQALLAEGLEMMRGRDQARRERDQARRERDQARRERDQARREAAVWRDTYQRATGTEPDAIEAGTLLGSVAGR